jgi:NADH-quinone oxidoreductase subunit M
VIASAAFALTAYQKTWYEEATDSVADLSSREWRVLAPILAVVVLFGVYSSPAIKMIEPVVAGLYGIQVEAKK